MSDESPGPRWDEPEQARPWAPEDGPEPRMTIYSYGHKPALRALVDGHWLWMDVGMRADYQDGRVAYHGDIQLPYPGGNWQSHRRAYWWPQPGQLRIALRPQ
jgi:hypothetical protein